MHPQLFSLPVGTGSNFFFKIRILNSASGCVRAAAGRDNNRDYSVKVASSIAGNNICNIPQCW